MNSAILQNLAALSQDLNEASDKLSHQITDFEAALNTLNLGVTAWITLYTISSQDPSIDEYVSIGYGKHKGKWGLLYGEFTDYPWGTEGQAQPLREAPRENRLRAVDKLPELVKKLEAEARKITEGARAKAVELKGMVGALRALTQ